MPVKIGSRKSHLAKVQAYTLEKAIKDRFPEVDTDFHFKASMGDLNLDMDLSKTDDKGVFTSDFFEMLINKQVDLVVHSWKDLPIEENEHSQITATLKREDTRDLFLLKRKASANKEWSVLTSSPRREFNLSEFFSYLTDGEQKIEFKSIRGNIPTRFKKFLEDESADGFCVAVAAVKRLIQDEAFNDDNPGIWDEISRLCHWAVLPASYCPSAAAQGALAVESLKSNSKLNEKLSTINDHDVMDAVQKERAILKKFGGGCHLAVGANVIKNQYGELTLTAGNVDGEKFRNLKFSPLKQYPKAVHASKVWMSTEEVKAERSKIDYSFSDDKMKSFMVTRFESFSNKAVSTKDLVHTSGLRTWKKLFQKGQWVNSCLDSLGVELYVGDLFNQGASHYWLTREGVEGPEGFETVETYSLDLEVDEETFQNKEIFLWMSGELMVESIKNNDELRNKKHFIGMGRSHDVVDSFVKNNSEILKDGFDVYAVHSLEQFKEDMILKD